MKLSDYHYHLPPELIAQSPAKPRDRARLLVTRKNKKDIEDKIFSDLIEYLQPGDLLVLNNSKVIPARLVGAKKTGGKVEILLSHRFETENEIWEAIGTSSKLNAGDEIIFSPSFKAVVIQKQNGFMQLRFNCSGKTFFTRLQRFGLIPLPPYIKSEGKRKDAEHYQTVYADKKSAGSVAAPTAGLHFTPRLLAELKKKKIKIAYVTLHVGLGTFRPIRTENIKDHVMHPEWIEVERKVFDQIALAQKNKNKVIAVGTTSIRALESAIRHKNAKRQGYSGWTNIFIYPPFKFKIIDGLITNFHLPESSLLLLVAALMGREKMFKAYHHAIKMKYRFYSYGDAMLIL